jgi:hypothetical protein
MSSNTPLSTTSDTGVERTFVEIPRAKPGQEYRAPKNYDQPFLRLLSRIVIVLMCLSLPITAGGIIAMILILDKTASTTQLWLWIPLGLFVEAFAIFLAIGVAREALGVAGSNQYTR